MAYKKINTTITRVAGDSWPVSADIKTNGNLVNLDGWTVYMYYTEIQEDESAIEVRITGVTSGTKGKAKFYPRDMYCYNVTNTQPYIGLAVVGEHTYSIVRQREFYEQNDAGGYVLIDDEYVVYDAGNTDHDGLQRYSPYNEVMTHITGKMVISDRAGL